MTNDDLMSVLGQYVQRSHYSARQVAALSGVSSRTLMNWLSGRVNKPHQWQGLAQVAQALHLTDVEFSTLLQAAGHPPLPNLRTSVTTPGDQQLLAAWPENRLAPFQALPDLPYFVGREQLLRDLQLALRQRQAVTICSLHGMGGIGKTALAAHLAYQLRPYFPDGVLWAQLDTADTMTILGAFAAAYGQDVSEFRDVDRRAAAVRTLLADKQVLLVLDNAQTSAQVRPLLPPTTGKASVIITTRYDLSVTDETTRFFVDTFDAEQGESLHVFRHFLGEKTLRRWLKPLQTIADLLGHLPLAITIAAGRLAAHGDITGYLAKLQAADEQLSALIREDRNVRLTFDLSYDGLSSDLQIFFTILSVFGGSDFDLAAAAYIADISPAQAELYLHTLQQYSLLQHSRSQRYRLHPLLRQYAQEKLTNPNYQKRMVQYYVHLLTPRDDNIVDVEIDNLTFALTTAYQMNWSNLYLTGVEHLFSFWETRGMFVTAIPYLEQAIQMARGQQLALSQSEHLYHLGKSLWNMGQYAAAETHLQQGLTIAQTLKEFKLQSDHLNSLGIIAAYNYGNYDLAEQRFSQALALARQVEYWPRITLLLSGLANIAYEQGHWHKAVAYWQEGLDLAEKINLQDPGMARLLSNLSVVSLGLGQFNEARDYLNRTLNLARQLQHNELICTTLAGLGWLALEEKQIAQARSHLNEALELARQISHPEALTQVLCRLCMLAIAEGDFAAAQNAVTEADNLVQNANIYWMEMDVLLEYGELAWARKEYAAALIHFTQARDKALTANLPEPQAFAHYYLARILTQERQYTQALIEAEASLTIFARLQHYKTTELQALIETIHSAAPTPGQSER